MGYTETYSTILGEHKPKSSQNEKKIWWLYIGVCEDRGPRGPRDDVRFCFFEWGQKATAVLHGLGVRGYHGSSSRVPAIRHGRVSRLWASRPHAQNKRVLSVKTRLVWPRAHADATNSLERKLLKDSGV